MTEKITADTMADAAEVMDTSSSTDHIIDNNGGDTAGDTSSLRIGADLVSLLQELERTANVSETGKSTGQQTTSGW